jgi:hypothetical protein
MNGTKEKTKINEEGIKNYKKYNSKNQNKEETIEAATTKNEGYLGEEERAKTNSAATTSATRTGIKNEDLKETTTIKTKNDNIIEENIH